MIVVVAIELLIAGALVLSYDNGALWWTALACALVLSALLVASPGRTSVARLVMLRLGLWRRRLLRGSEPDGSKPDQAPFDIPIPDGTPIGARWDGTSLITVLRIDTPPPAIGLLDPHGCTGIPGIPLTALARERSPVRHRARIDRRHQSWHPVARHRPGGAGLPAHAGPIAGDGLPIGSGGPATRSVPVPGGGGPSRRRIRGCTAHRAGRHPSGRQPDRWSRAVGNRVDRGRDHRGHNTTGSRRRRQRRCPRRWESVSVGRLQMSTFAISPDHLASALAAVWAVPSVSTTVTSRFRSTPDGGTSLRTLVRFNTLDPERAPDRRAAPPPRSPASCPGRQPAGGCRRPLAPDRRAHHLR